MSYKARVLEVAAGGTGLSTTTANQLLYSSSTGVIAGLATANSSVLTTTSGGVPQLSSRILGVNGGGLVLVSTQSASSSASISFTGLTAYPVYFVLINGAGPTTGGSTLRMLASSNNGSSYSTSGYTAGINHQPYNSTTLTNVNSTTYFPISGATSNNSCNSVFYLFNTNVGNNISILGNCAFYDGSTTNTGAYMGTGPTGTNAIQFIYTAGNISSGTFSLYGLQTA